MGSALCQPCIWHSVCSLVHWWSHVGWCIGEMEHLLTPICEWGHNGPWRLSSPHHASAHGLGSDCRGSRGHHMSHYCSAVVSQDVTIRFLILRVCGHETGFFNVKSELLFMEKGSFIQFLNFHEGWRYFSLTGHISYTASPYWIIHLSLFTMKDALQLL